MMQNKLFVIGVTGGIGAGKSAVTAYLKQKGFPVADADRISHELTAPGGKGTLAILEAFGDAYVKDGVLDRRALAGLVFSDELARKKLDSILHPMVIDEMKSQLAMFETQGNTVAVIDVPLLFECGADVLADEVWCADAPRDVRIARIVARDNLDAAQAQARIDAQMDDALRRAKSNVILDSAGELSYLHAQIDALLQERGWTI